MKTYIRLIALLSAALLLSGLSGCGGSGSSLPQIDLPPPSDEDYFYSALLDGQYIIRWSRMPVRVYIDTSNPPDNWKPEHKVYVEQALSKWAEASGGALSFTAITSLVNPAISVKWVKNRPDPNNPAVIGTTKLTYTSTSIVSMEILLSTSNQAGGPLSDSLMRLVSLHELGHAVGIMGHSDVDTDVMYPILDSSMSPELSERDTATLVKLYGIRPHITDTTRAIRAYPPDVREYTIPGSVLDK